MEGFSFVGARWTDTPIRWSFAGHSDLANGQSSFSSVIDPALQPLIRAAFTAWKAVSGLVFEEVPAGSSTTDPVDIRIGWGKFGAAASRIGETALRYQDGVIQPGITIRLQDPQERPLVRDSTGDLLYQGTQSELYALVLHEIGHALGLGHSADVTAVMYPTIGSFNAGLGPSDIAGIRTLYADITAGQFTLVNLLDGTQHYIGGSDYDGPVTALRFQYIGSSQSDIIIGTTSNDFINSGTGDDAISAGAGDDVIDGGTGSNFLTGGLGQDTFYLDGRGGTPTWSTVADWETGEQVCLWGWRTGVSQALWVEAGGLPGHSGATLHADLDGNGSIDVSITWANVTPANLPQPVELDGLLWFR